MHILSRKHLHLSLLMWCKRQTSSKFYDNRKAPRHRRDGIAIRILNIADGQLLLPHTALILVALLCLALTAQAKPSTASTTQRPALERADLCMVGSSCAVCLMRVEGKISKAPGVLKAAVSIFSPYSAIIIYDPAKTNLEKIRSCLTGEPVKFDHVTERPIEKVPDIILPLTRAVSGQSSNEGAQ